MCLLGKFDEERFTFDTLQNFQTSIIVFLSFTRDGFGTSGSSSLRTWLHPYVCAAWRAHWGALDAGSVGPNLVCDLPEAFSARLKKLRR